MNDWLESWEIFVNFANNADLVWIRNKLEYYEDKK